jgi:hypothetical protein
LKWRRKGNEQGAASADREVGDALVMVSMEQVFNI